MENRNLKGERTVYLPFSRLYILADDCSAQLLGHTYIHSTLISSYRHNLQLILHEPELDVKAGLGRQRTG